MIVQQKNAFSLCVLRLYFFSVTIHSVDKSRHKSVGSSESSALWKYRRSWVVSPQYVRKI